MQRYLEKQIRQDLNRKMVFLGGPRQVGKTTIAKTILGKQPGYLNWDILDDRSLILQQKLPKLGLLVLDEIHKYRKWRNYIKGLYDGRRAGQRILVTGSARLDYYRFGGDSLQGRYHYLRLHPLSVAELGINTEIKLHKLLTLGGFPEPYLSDSEVEAKRWTREYSSRLINEDISKIESIQDLGSLELLTMRLPDLVGSPLSINALSEDLQVSHKTLSKWLQVLERVYSIFRLSPVGTPQLNAVKKAQKHYHFDWTLVKDHGDRFENFVACHLLKWIHYRQDTLGEDVELRYFRDQEGREVDFVVLENRKPAIAIEVKLGKPDDTKNLSYLKRKFQNMRAILLHNNPNTRSNDTLVTKDGIEITRALSFLRELV